MFGTADDNGNPDCVFVWKVPAVKPPDHIGQEMGTIETFRQQIPKRFGQESFAHFNRIISGISNVNGKVKKALRNYIFLGDANCNNESDADEYVELVMNLTAGESIHPALFLDGNTRNGGTSIGQTKYKIFWDACREVLLPERAVEERRQSDVLHASRAHSIPNLIKQAKGILQRRVDIKELASFPKVPCEEWVRLQFVPNNAFRDAAVKFSGELGVICGIQTRTLRKEHKDQHWANAMTRYYLEWMVDLRQNFQWWGILWSR